MESATSPRNTSSIYSLSWKWMRYSAFLLIPLVWIHAILQALITGGHNLSLEYVQTRWALWGWRAYDIFLLAFALSHGANGLRQVLSDFIKTEKALRTLNWSIAIFWFLLTMVGALAIIGGVKTP